MTTGSNNAEPTFSDSIEAEIHRGRINSPAAEEVIQLESWMRGTPTPGTPAHRFKTSQKNELQDNRRQPTAAC